MFTDGLSLDKTFAAARVAMAARRLGFEVFLDLDDEFSTPTDNHPAKGKLGTVLGGLGLAVDPVTSQKIPVLSVFQAAVAAGLQYDTLVHEFVHAVHFTYFPEETGTLETGNGTFSAAEQEAVVQFAMITLQDVLMISDKAISAQAESLAWTYGIDPSDKAYDASQRVVEKAMDVLLSTV